MYETYTYNTRSNPLSTSIPQAQRNDNDIQYSTTLYSGAVRALNNLANHLKLAAGWEEWILALLKRRVETLRYLAKEDRHLRNLANPSGNNSSNSSSSALFDTLASFQDDAAERANSYISLETFIRLNLIQPLEKDIKARTERLKGRQKSIQELLSKLENSEKIYTRATADLEVLQRKYTYLKQRQALDLPEEIEKIEIDLRKAASALSVKGAECDIAYKRMADIQQKWKTEWESFTNLAGIVDLERHAHIRKVSMELLQAEMLVKEAALAREQNLYSRLRDIDLLAADVTLLPSDLGTNIQKAPAATTDIANSLWPKTSVTQQQLATLHAPPPPTKSSDAALKAATETAKQLPISGQPSDRPSAPRTYSEDSFSTPRTEQPILQVLTADEMDQVAPRFPSLDSMATLNENNASKPAPYTLKKPRKPSKPLPGLPATGETLSPEVVSNEDSRMAVGESEQGEMEQESESVKEVLTTLPLQKPPSLPSFSDLRSGSLGWEIVPS